MALIAGSLLIGVYNTRELLTSVLPPGTVIKFESYEDNLRYILRRIREAKHSVYDITWLLHLKPGALIGPMLSSKDREDYFQAIEHTSGKIPYREIVMFCSSPGRVEKARRLIEQAGEYYELAVYPDLPANAPPRWQFLIVDEEEVLLADWRLAVRQPDIVAAFCNYYQDLWKTAIYIGAAKRTESKERLEEAIGQYYTQRVENHTLEGE